MQNTKDMAYTQTMSGAEAWRFIKAIGFPAIVLFLSVYTISTFAKFGSYLIAPFVAVMWGLGAVEALFFGAQRKSILNEAMVFVAIYDVALLGLRLAIKLVSNVSTEQLVASYNEVITLSQSTSIPGYLQNALWIAAVMTPLGYIGMQAKRIFQFRKKISKQKFFEQARSIRN